MENTGGPMDLSDLITSIDILEYISQYTDFEEKNGEYWALSPERREDALLLRPAGDQQLL